MIKEIALDPCLFAQWQHYLALRDVFGVEKGRVISAFSKKWKGLVREEVNRLIAAELIGANKGKSILAWLTVPFGTTETRMVTSAAAYDGNKPWHLNAEDNWSSFDAILSHREVTSENAVLADDEYEYLRHPKLTPETQRTIARQRGPIVDCAWSLLRDSKVVKLVEPHFNPHKPRFLDVLEAMLDRLHTEGSSVREIELHVRHPEDKDPQGTTPPLFTVPELRSKLSPLLRSGWSLRVHLWRRGREKMHPRYLLTDRGGIQIDHGWDEGEHDTETTPILLLNRARWEQEMQRYQPCSQDFMMNPVTDIVHIT
ncbi:MAG TPA: hypothetical protein PK490_01220 [Prosthecobacter sp.]|nr:hypothetical protein [Prosthecobacter sp.]HRK12872.1 hypothetical protein [Prosthecobacter sp.]